MDCVELSTLGQRVNAGTSTISTEYHNVRMYIVALPKLLPSEGWGKAHGRS